MGKLKGLRFDSMEYGQTRGVIKMARRIIRRHKARKVGLYNTMDPRPYGV